MKTKILTSNACLYLIVLILVQCSGPQIPVPPSPHLEKSGEATRLIVDGEPFLVLAGELHNSSSSSREYMKDIWPKLDSMNLNAVLAVVEWSLVEPEEGVYDFSLVDGLLEDARANDLRLVLLWFGAWKNGQSHYVPAWVKKDYERFPRVRTRDGKSLEILSALDLETMDADATAFASMMKHVKERDSLEHTVIMVQIQNEVGIIGSPRDFSDAASNAFSARVPPELMNYLIEYREDLLPGLEEKWAGTGYTSEGSWEEVFGPGKETEELFMAWNYARYLDYCAVRGKEAYDIPMFVNAWIVQPGDRYPGDYPSGGPQAHVLDLWRAGAPHIDLYCPDIYLPDFAGICEEYTMSGNPLFIPEARAGEHGAGQALYAIGRHLAIGYSPFGIDSRVNDPAGGPIPRTYAMLESMDSLILDAQQKGSIDAILLNTDNNPEETIHAGEYNMHFELRKGWRSDYVSPFGYALIIELGPDEFIVAGKDVQASFSVATPGPDIAAILWLEEGRFEDNIWVARRRLNGDAIMLDYDLAKMAARDMTGTGIKFTGEDRAIQRLKLYRFE